MLGIGEAVAAVSNLATTIIDKKFPNATEIEKIKLTQLATAMQNEFSLMLGQIEINKIEAANPNIFVSGGRPAAMWVCVAGLAYTVAYPMLTWGAQSVGLPAIPALDTAVLQYLLGALLGVGAMRSYDKMNGVDTKGVSFK